MLVSDFVALKGVGLQTNAVCEENNPEENVTIFPSPTPDFLNLRMAKGVELISLVNEAGTNVLPMCTKSSTENYEYVDVSALTTGIYFLLFSNCNKIIYKKFIKI